MVSWLAVNSFGLATLLQGRAVAAEARAVTILLITIRLLLYLKLHLFFHKLLARIDGFKLPFW